MLISLDKNNVSQRIKHTSLMMPPKPQEIFKFKFSYKDNNLVDLLLLLASGNIHRNSYQIMLSSGCYQLMTQERTGTRVGLFLSDTGLQ